MRELFYSSPFFFISLHLSLYLAIFPSHWIKENAKDFSFIQTNFHIHIDTQHHDAAIWSRISAKWSLLFRYCCCYSIHLCDCVWLCAFALVHVFLSLCLPVEPVLLIIHITVRELYVSVKQVVSNELEWDRE